MEDGAGTHLTRAAQLTRIIVVLVRITIKRLHGRLTQAKKQPIKYANTSNAGPSLFIPPMNIGELDSIKVLWIRSLRSMVRSFHGQVVPFYSQIVPQFQYKTR